MWTRADLKTKGKQTFLGNYWTTVGCLFAISVISAGVSGICSKVLPAAGFVALILVGYPLIVSGAKFSLDNREGKASAEDIFYGFKAGYGNIIMNMFMLELFVTLWTFLLVVPGIIKAYTYRMVPFIVAERPDIDYKEALDLSKKVMDGEKMNTFVLDLSFIGWGLLTALTAGILGVFYTTPYIQQTNAELYVTLKTKLEPQTAETQM